MLSLIKGLIPGANIIEYIKWGALIALGLVIWYFVNDYQNRGEKITTLTAEVQLKEEKIRQEQDRTIEVIKESNASIDKLQGEIADIQASYAVMLERMQAAQAKAEEISAEAEKQKAMYERDRLERLSKAKGGLLTRLAKKGALKRNREWESITKETEGEEE